MEFSRSKIIIKEVKFTFPIEVKLLVFDLSHRFFYSFADKVEW